MTDQAIRDFFAAWELSDFERSYLRFHAKRYSHLLAQVERLVSGPPSDRRMLDIGPGFQTALLRERWPEATVNSLGFGLGLEGAAPRAHEEHWTFDLNDSYFPDRRPDLPPHDVVVMGEVIEHLYTAPRIVLETLRGFMAPSGHLLVQTPNACALHKRLQLLAGRHPYPPINESREHPDHFREYTPAELEAAGAAAGLACTGVQVLNYFDRGGAAARAYNALARVLPPSMRAGITIAFRAPAG